jgi:tetratricopeptide (TPR) repeat protein
MPRFAASAPADAVSRPTVRPPGERLTVILGVFWLVILAGVTLAHPSATRMHTWPWAGFVLLIWVLPVVAMLGTALTGPTWRLPSWPIVIGLVLLVGGAILSASLSPFAPASLLRLWPTLGGSALLLWLYHRWSGETAEERRSHAGTLAVSVAVAGTVLALVCVVAWPGLTWPLPWQSRNPVPFGHSTYTAGAIVALVPWIALQAWNTAGLRRLAWLVASAAGLLALASTSSRGGVLGLAGAAGLVTVGVIVFGGWSRRRKVASALGLLALGALVVATNPRLRELVIHRQWGADAAESNSQRRAMLDAGIKLGTERPLLGWGPGIVPLAYPKIRSALDGGVENVLQLHSTPAQIWATMGAIGLAAALFLAAGLLTALRRAPKSPTTIAAAASLAGYALMALTDHQLDVPAITVAVVVGSALLLVSAPRPSEVRPGRGLRFGVVAIGGAMIVGLASPTLSDMRARQLYDDALSELAAGRTPEAIAALDEATRVTPHDSFFDHMAAAHRWMDSGSEAELLPPADRIRDAITRLERSLATGAHREFAHFNLGWLLLETGQPAQAVRHFIAAAQLVPDKGGVYFGLGLALRASGNQGAALRAFALEWINDPLTFTSPAWEVSGLAVLVPAIREEAGRVLETLASQFPATARIGPWLRWWWEPGTREAHSARNGPPSGWNAASHAFVAAWPAIAAQAPLAAATPTSAWERVYSAWRTVATTDEAAPTAFALSANGDTALAQALTRRAQQTRADFPTFLAGATGDEATLIRTLRRVRPGYGVLALHPEGAPLQDVYVVQENRVTTAFAAGLFPRKGWVPGRFLLALLPDDPR